MRVHSLKKSCFSSITRFICFVLIITFTITTVCPSGAQAQMFTPEQLPVAAAPVQPVMLQGMTVHPDNPLQLDFIVDSGDSNLAGEDLQAETRKLVNYFITSLTVPKQDMWVNLSPYEPDRIIPDGFGQTEMGRVLLEQDYVLKQITASLMSPESPAGQRFWDRIYKQAYEQYGVTDIPMDTFNKVWIVPSESLVYENASTNTVFVSKSELDVMLDGDYLSRAASESKRAALGADNQDVEKAPAMASLDQTAQNVIRDVILPELRREVNEGEAFAPLRQIMHSLILASWYKSELKQSVLTRAFADQGKIAGQQTDPNDKQKIYEQYVSAFQRGAYDVIREDYDPVKSDVVTKKYFSGGINNAALNVGVDTSRAMLDVLSLKAEQGLLSAVSLNYAMMGKMKDILEKFLKFILRIWIIMLFLLFSMIVNKPDTRLYHEDYVKIEKYERNKQNRNGVLFFLVILAGWMYVISGLYSKNKAMLAQADVQLFNQLNAAMLKDKSFRFDWLLLVIAGFFAIRLGMEYLPGLWSCIRAFPRWMQILGFFATILLIYFFVGEEIDEVIARKPKENKDKEKNKAQLVKSIMGLAAVHQKSPLNQPGHGGIDLEQMNVGRVNAGESPINLRFRDDPAMLQRLQNATGLEINMGVFKPVTLPVLNGLLGLNADESGGDAADSGASFEQLAALRDESMNSFISSRICKF